MATTIVDLGNRAGFPASLVSVSPPSGTIVGSVCDLKDVDSYCNVWVCVTPTAGTNFSGVIQLQVQCADGPLSGFFYSGGAAVYAYQPLSGNFTDPTSGLASTALGPAGFNQATFPAYVLSGGNIYVNSGLYPVIGGGFQIFPVSGFPQSGGALGTPYQGGFPAGTFPHGLTPTINATGGAELAVSGTGNQLSGFAYSGSFPRLQNGGMAIVGFQRTNQFARLILVSGQATGALVTAGFLSMAMGGGQGFSWLPASGLSGGVGGGGFIGVGAGGMPLV